MKKSTISHSAPEFTTSIFGIIYEPKKYIERIEDRNNYKTNTVSKKLEKYVTYDEEGNFIEVEMAMEVSELPVSAIEYVKKNYMKNTILEASQIMETDGTVIYKAELKTLNLFFDSIGNFIRLLKK